MIDDGRAYRKPAVEHRRRRRSHAGLLEIDDDLAIDPVGVTFKSCRDPFVEPDWDRCQTVQNATTDDMIFDVASLISILSEAITLSAGDIIVTGTPSGVGMARKPQLFMQDGDICEIELEGVGTLRNYIADEVMAAKLH